MSKFISKQFVIGGLMAALGLGATQSLAALVIDLRAIDSSNNATATPKSVSVTTGSVVHLGLFATVTGANGSTTDEGLQTVYGSVVSSLTGGGSAIGNMSTVTIQSPFTTTQSGGLVQDLNGQPGLDVGSTSVTNDYILGRASAIQSGNAFLIGTLDWTVTSLPNTGTTLLNFVPRSGTTSAVWREDTVTKTPASSSFAAGTPINVAVPEPASLAAISLGAVAALRRRRSRAA
jgi:hypothetical protein